MNILKKMNIKNISLLLCYLTISAYIVLGNCLTFNLGNRMPIKVAEIIALFSCAILVILHRKDAIKLSKDNIKILIWFVIAAIPMFFYDYTLNQVIYGLLYSARIVATLFVAIAITNIFRKYEISRDKICKYFINNYLIVGLIGIFQLIFFPEAYDFYDIFYKLGVYFTNPDPHVGRLVSTYFDPNFLAACLIIPTMFALNYFVKTGKKVYLAEVIFFITTIVLTVSRSGILGICLALFIYAICTVSFKNRKLQINLKMIRAFAVMIIIAIVFFVLMFFTNVRVFQRILGTANDESTYKRIEDWSNGLQMLGDNESNDKQDSEEDNQNESRAEDSNILLGIGYNMLGFTEANEDKASSAAFGNDSSILVIIISSGIIGSLYSVYIIGSRLIKSYKERKKYTDNSSMIAIIVTSIVICNFNNLLFYTLWLLPIFILINLDQEEKLPELEYISSDNKKEPKKIGIDGRALTAKRAGIGNYTYEIIKKLNEIDKINEYYIYSNKEISLDFKLGKNWHICEHKFKVGTIWLYSFLPYILKKDRIDVFWGTQHVLPMRTNYTKNIRYVLTIHDLAIFKLKNIGSIYNTIVQRVFVENSLGMADKIIAVSESTKKDIVEIFEIPEEKIKVIYSGTSFEKQINIDEKEEIKEKDKIQNEPYIYFVSTIEPRKNIETLIKAFDYVKEKKNDKLKLVIAGGLGWKYKKVLELIKNSKYTEDIVMLGYISKKEKQNLFKNAECFVYPSLYEGFGLPILEAMSNECLVVTANNSSLPEVGGEAVYYYDDVKNHENLGETIIKVLNLNKEEKQEKIKQGLEQVEKFKWGDTATEVLKILND